jgi:hypothetical protein
LGLAWLVNGLGPVEFGAGVHLDIEEGPSVEESRLVIVLVPFYVMWNPCDRALLKHSSSSCYQVELWRSGLDDVIRVCALNLRGSFIVGTKLKMLNSDTGDDT